VADVGVTGMDLGLRHAGTGILYYLLGVKNIPIETDVLIIGVCI
jgi:hypothetical protein